MTGSERVLSHTSFPELNWKRDPLLSSLYTLPQGFMTKSALLGEETTALFEDIRALQVMRDSLDFHYDDPASILYFDNQQAWTESRLYNCRKALSQSDYVLDCCLIAAYLCTYVMFTDIWGGSLIPGHCSSQLLRRLQQKELDNQWIGNKDLLFWLLCIGGAFAPRGIIRSDYVVLLNGTHCDQLGPMTDTWSGAETHLKLFFWSEKAFRERCKTFWEESCSF
jgi:hypothetical protein